MISSTDCRRESLSFTLENGTTERGKFTLSTCLSSLVLGKYIVIHRQCSTIGTIIQSSSPFGAQVG